MGTFIIARRSQEHQAQKNGSHEVVDVYNFGNKPKVYSTLEDAAEACDKLVKNNVLSTWCTFELVAETKLDTEAPVKTFLVSDREVSASSAEP